MECYREALPGKAEGQAKAVIKTWVKDKTLARKDYINPKTGKTVKGLYLKTPARVE